MTSLAEQAGDRTIHAVLDIMFTSPIQADVGSTDPAMAIGAGLINEIGLMAKNLGEAEGFVVRVKTSVIVVY